jgi:hypothetical protein
MPNRKAIILLVVLAVMLILTIGLIFAGKAFFGILTAVIAGIFAKSTDASKKIGEVIKTEKERSKERQKQAGQLNQQADNWEEKNKRRRQGKLGKPPNINVILLLFVILVGSVSAAGGLYIPKNYNELKALYIDADRALQDGKKIIDQYKNLYSGAEASNKKITDELADAKLIIDSQNKALAAAKVTMEQQDKRSQICAGRVGELPGALILTGMELDGTPA